jgi:hypothetical protein
VFGKYRTPNNHPPKPKGRCSQPGSASGSEAEPDGAGDIVVAVAIESVSNEVAQLVRFGAGVEVLEPQSLRDEFARLARTLLGFSTRPVRNRPETCGKERGPLNWRTTTARTPTRRKAG